MIVASVVAHLKLGAVANVVQYGAKDLPDPPYVVVRPENSVIRPGRSLVVIAHFEPGQQSMLEDYVFNKLSDYLTDFEGVTAEGIRFHVYATQEWTDIITGNDDGTISMERVFLLPGMLF